MAKLLGITSGNGGMGKSSAACNIACGLCFHGKRVLLVECSFGTRADDVILGIKPETLYTFSDICSGECNVSDAVTKACDEYLPDFIPAGIKKFQADYKKVFSKLKSQLSSQYDYIVFDVSAGCDGVFEALTNICDEFIVLTDTSFISVRNSAYCADIIKRNSSSKIYTIFSKITVSQNDTTEFAEDIIDEIKAPLLGIIPYDEHHMSCMHSGEIIYKYNTYSGRAYENICKRLMGEQVPVYETGVSAGLFAKNKFVLK